MTFASYSKEKKLRIGDTIQTFLEGKKKSITDPFLLEALEKLKTFSKRGKMLRGIFVLLAFEMYKGDATEEVYKAAAAIELLHSGFLIHDDIMDNDTLRRGEKTIFAQYGTNLYGESIAICIGDYAFFSAMELLENPLVIKKVAQELQEVGLAQMKDVVFGTNTYEPSEGEIRHVYRLKTARYSFSLPFTIGGLLAGSDKDSVCSLEAFGEKLGIAFQIRDDELGIFGEERVLGKPVGSDIRENKKTLLRCYLYEKVDAEEKGDLEGIFGKKKLNEEDVIKVRSMLQKYAILGKLRQEKKKLIEEGLVFLDTASIDEDYKAMLVEIAKKQIERAI